MEFELCQRSGRSLPKAEAVAVTSGNEWRCSVTEQQRAAFG
jgi:hypothetical protein